MSIVRSIRIQEEIWDAVKRLSKEENKTITAILNEALESYIAGKTGEKAVNKLKNMPGLSLGGKTFKREEAYEGRY